MNSDFPQSPLAAREERCLPLGIGMILPFSQKSLGKHTMFLSHETNFSAFSFPFLEMSEVGRFQPQTVQFWDDSDGGIYDKLLELGSCDAVDGRAGWLTCNWGKGRVGADSWETLQL